MAEDDDPLIDVVVGGKYRIRRKLGVGGMSTVYEAEHVKLHRAFAIKRLHESFLDNEEALTRFEREANLLASMRHPNVVEISDWDTFPDGTPCMVLEFLHGNDLGVRLHHGPLPWEAIARIGDQAMSALALAHRNGITHRDLKPENIFISIDDSGDERVKLLDFGISKQRGAVMMTGIGTMLGTPGYMSPEQAMGQTDRIGPSTDVWAMGALLYEMATGQPAFRGNGIAEILMAVLSGTPDPIPAFRNDAPVAFVDLVNRALSRDPAYRIQTIDHLRALLRGALDPRNLYRLNTPIAGIPIVPMAPLPPAPPKPPTLPHPTQTFVRRSYRGLLIGGTVALALMIGGTIAIILGT